MEQGKTGWYFKYRKYEGQTKGERSRKNVTLQNFGEHVKQSYVLGKTLWADYHL